LAENEGCPGRVVVEPLLDMLTHRNLMSHTYDQARFTEVVEATAARYAVTVAALVADLLARRESASSP
jgi:hypothetical protein